MESVRQRKLYLHQALLSKLKAEEIAEICRSNGLEAGDDAVENARKYAAFILSKEQMERRLMPLRKSELDFFRQAVSTGHEFLPAPSQYSDADTICALQYGFIENDGKYVIPSDVADAFRAIDTEQFRRQIERAQWIFVCMRTVEILYWTISLKDFAKLVRRKKEYRGWTDDEIMQEFSRLEDNPGAAAVKRGNYIVAKSLLPNSEYVHALQIQQGIEASIPPYGEISEIDQYGWPAGEKEWVQLKKFLIKDVHLSVQAAEIVSAVAWRDMVYDTTIEVMMEDLDAQGIEIPERETGRFIMMLHIIEYNARKAPYRGARVYQTPLKEMWEQDRIY